MVNVKIPLYVLSVLPLVTLITTYVMNHELGHQTQTIPYISSSIDKSPESCIGTFGLSISAFCMVFIIISRYYFNRFVINNSPYLSWDNSTHGGRGGGGSGTSDTTKLRMNQALAIIGVVSAISLHGVASFQYSRAPVPHLISATLFFVGGILYICLHTYLDHIMESVSNPTIVYIRKVLCVLAILFFFPYLILQFLHSHKINSDIAAAFEISSAASLFSYFITFWYEANIFSMTIDIQYSDFSKNYQSTRL